MDSAARLAAPVVDPLTVGRAFVLQYYHILYNMPEHLHRFYQEISKVGRVGQDGVMRVFSTLQGISEELKTLSYGDFKSAKITSYDAQESHNGGFLLLVTGYFTLNKRLRRKFTQTFFLAPQENGYFVLNDILRFVNEPDATDAEVVSGKEFETPSPINAPTGNQGSEMNPVCKEESKPLNVENAKEYILVPEIINEEVAEIEITCKEVADDSLKRNDGLEDVPKKSYASVLKVTRDKSGVSAGPSQSPKQIPKEQGQQASWDPSPVIESEAVSASENGQNQLFEAVAEGTSIYVKHLPANATIEMVETEFKRFGAIKSGGIQVVNQRGCGFPFGFVEFEEADAAQKAIEASPVMIGGQRAFVEEKRSRTRGNRGSVGVRGGYGRGGGRSFNRRGYEYAARINTY